MRWLPSVALLPLVLLAASTGFTDDFDQAVITDTLPPALEVDPTSGKVALMLRGSHLDTGLSVVNEARFVHVYVRGTTREPTWSRGRDSRGPDGWHPREGYQDFEGWHLLFANNRDYDQPSSALGTDGPNTSTHREIELDRAAWIAREGTLEFKIVKVGWDPARKKEGVAIRRLSESEIFRVPVVKEAAYFNRITRVDPAALPVNATNDQLTVYGSFPPGSRVFLNNVPCDENAVWAGGVKIVCRVPRKILAVPGRYALSVLDPQQTPSDTATFSVLGPTRIVRFDPRAVVAGPDAFSLGVAFDGVPPKRAELRFDLRATGAGPSRLQMWRDATFEIEGSNVVIAVPAGMRPALGTLRVRLTGLGADTDDVPITATVEGRTPMGPVTRVPDTPDLNAPVTIEAESLAGTVRAQGGRAIRQDMGRFGRGWSGNAQLLWMETTTGAKLSIPLNAPRAGRYDIYVYYTTGPDYGTVEAYRDGARFGNAVNAYALRVGRRPALRLGTATLAAGANWILLHVSGKDRRSAGHLVGIDAFELKPRP